MRFLGDQLGKYFALLGLWMTWSYQVAYDFVIQGFHDDAFHNEVDCGVKQVRPIINVKKINATMK